MADFGITQFFFRAADYIDMVDELRALGCDTPVLAGIMPITNVASVARMSQLAGYPVPAEVVARFDGIEHDPRPCGGSVIAMASELCEELLSSGVPGPALLHAQPVAGDPRDLPAPGPGSRQSRRLRSAGRS